MSWSRSGARLASVVSAALVTALLVVATPGSASALDSPGGLSVADGSARILSWDRVVGATAYDVQVSQSPSFSPTLASVSTVNDEYVPVVQLPAGEVWWRVRAKMGSTLGDWTISSFTVTAGAAPVPIEPLTGHTFQAPTAPLFSWQPVAGATSYTVQTGPDPAFTDPALYATNKQKTTAAYLGGYPPAGDYYWRVQAELSTGYATAWSAPLLYHVDGLPPAELQAPVDDFGPEVTDVVLDWKPVPGAANYDLQVGTDENFLTVVHEESGITGTRYSPPTTLANDEYYWRVRPVDGSGNAAPWPATPWKFRRAWSAQPTATYPQGTVDTSRPFFYQWQPIERASKYKVYLYDETGEQVCTTTTVHTTIAGACVPTKTGTFRWKVQGIDDTQGVVTVWLAQAPTWFDYTLPGVVTPAPAGSLSVSDVTGMRVSLTGTAAFSGLSGDTCEGMLPATCLDLRQTPVLTWDPVAGASSYRLTISYDRELTNVYGTYTVSQPMWTPPTSTTLPDSQAGSAYFWVVQPCGVSCAPTAFPTHSFAKKTIAPALLSPANGEVVSDDVQLSWSSELSRLAEPGASDGSAVTTAGTMEAKNYLVETSIDPGFASKIESTLVDQTSFTSFSGTYPEGIVYWRVRAIDGGGTSSVWSAVRSFEKRSPVPELLTPADGDALGQDYTLRWKPLDFAASYDVEVYAGPTKVATATSIYSSWTPSAPFPASADGYTWRVRRVDAGGRKGDWSATRSFRFEGFQPSLVAPAPSAVVAPTAGRFSWLPDARATSYRFERRKPGTTDLAETVTTRATVWSPIAALAAGTAQWRVVALDASGVSLGASPWRDFVVIDPPLVVTPVTITGSGALGSELRAYAPTFEPAATTTAYQWYRGTSLISGSTGETYTVVSTDIGKAITVKATGTVAGYQNATSTSNAITGTAEPSLAVVTAVSITGSGTLGSVLQGYAPTFEPAATTTAYQWYRGTSPISGATGDTYTVVSTDIGKAITLKVTGTAPGYQDTASTSNTITGAPAPALTVAIPVSITGSGAVGTVLSAVAPTFDPAAATTYQWFRGTTAITGATGDTYAVVATDLSKSITVKATGAVAGYQPTTSTSNAVVGAPGAPLVADRAPVVTGTAAVGGKLSVSPGGWPAGARLTYQWFRDGAAIPGAIASTYTPSTADAGRVLKAVETATLTAYQPGTATSAPVSVAKVASTAKVLLSATTTTVRKRVTATVTITASGIAAPGGSVSLYVGAKRIKVLALGTGTKVTLRLPKLPAGKFTVKAVYSGGPQVLGAKSSVRLKVARR
ncbi:hypothetical protein GON03_09900 [Nocardioides sp. MAH-18]|uniref:Fibronectin type-III domain-containing protein n=1 Tax=Nocardioides agri TaxID=2682843 RepID=A0A6L6XRQ9_9ACTN|nr:MULTISPECIES: Ig-like domain repeat protein [unclassified Nocardioides]MBA2954635.1 Ig-like domain repeat protein [Nocardioides sp. CGMCC 1.13656]MVQ49492.1 hypothetical protein [Nocardioides sp. MAH-18]